MQEEFVPSATLQGCFATGVVARVSCRKVPEGGVCRDIESLRGWMSDAPGQVWRGCPLKGMLRDLSRC